MRILFVCAALVALMYVSGCSNTFHGVGADMERAGEKIQQTF